MPSDPYKIAKKKVKAKKEFYRHLTSFVIVNTFLFALNMFTSPFHYWFIYPLMGWGLGLASHYFSVFGIPGAGSLDEQWEEKEIEKELRKMDKENDTELELPEDEELELKEFKKLRKDWEDSDFV